MVSPVSPTTTSAASNSSAVGFFRKFASEVAANRDALTNPQLVYSDDIEPLLDLFGRWVADRHLVQREIMRGRVASHFQAALPGLADRLDGAVVSESDRREETARYWSGWGAEIGR